MAKLTGEQKAKIADRLAASGGKGVRALAREHGVSHTAILKAVKSARQGRRGAKLMDHEASALRRLLAEMSAGPEFIQRWSTLDLQTCVLALKRVTGVDATGAGEET